MYCDASYHSNPFDTLEQAKFDCANRPGCVGLVDHTANQGKIGVCGRNTKFSVGTDHADAFVRVCVEKKPLEPSMLLQAGDGERAQATLSMWEQVHDMMCDDVEEWQESLESAKAACLQKQTCAGVMDHSSTQGKFGLCDSKMQLKQASSVFNGWKTLSVHIKH